MSNIRYDEWIAVNKELNAGQPNLEDLVQERYNEYKAEKCPKCGGPLGEFSRQALSRRDNETMICSDCGTREAIEDLQRVMENK